MTEQYNDLIEFTVKQSNLTRIDKLLSLRFEELTRSKICSLIENGNILVNGKKIEKNYKAKDFHTMYIAEIEKILTNN